MRCSKIQICLARAGRVKIYNVKMLKTELARGIPKQFVKIKHYSGAFQSNLMADVGWVSPISFAKKKPSISYLIIISCHFDVKSMMTCRLSLPS